MFILSGCLRQSHSVATGNPPGVTAFNTALFQQQSPGLARTFYEILEKLRFLPQTEELQHVLKFIPVVPFPISRQNKNVACYGQVILKQELGHGSPDRLLATQSISYFEALEE